MSDAEPKELPVDLLVMLAKWLRDERQAAFKALAGRPSAIEIQQLVATRDDNGQWSGKYVTKNVTPFYNVSYAIQLGLLDWNKLDPSAVAVADSIVHEHQPTLVPISAVGGGLGWAQQHLADPSVVDERDDKEVFVAVVHALSAARQHYLGSLSDLAADDQTLIDSVVKELTESFEVAQLEGRSLIPIQAPYLGDSTLSEGPVTIRPLSPTEAGELIFTSHEATLPGGANREFMRNIDTDLVGITHMLSWQQEVTTDEARGSYTTAWRPFLLAMAILGHPLKVVGHVTSTIIPRWFSIGKFGTPVITPQIAATNAPELTRELIGAALTLSKKLSENIFTEPSGFDETTIRRFVNALGRTSAGDGLVDLVTCLEGLLVPSTATEISYRFRVHGALYLANAKDERSELYESLKAMYDTRSKIVHRSSSFPKHDVVSQQRSAAFELARRGLLKAIEIGWPDESAFRKLLLD